MAKTDHALSEYLRQQKFEKEEELEEELSWNDRPLHDMHRQIEEVADTEKSWTEQRH